MNINEIAALAGVSRATVSRYLNGGYVSEEKRERLRNIIEETGYRPSGIAQSLRKRKSHFIGVIVPKIESASISRIVRGISETLSEAGYRLLLACTHNDEKEELNYLNLFKENQVDGILLVATILTKEHKALLEELTVPVVLLGQHLPGFTSVFHDDYEAARALTRCFLPTAKTFAYIGVTERDRAVGDARKKGIFDVLREEGTIPLPEGPYVRKGTFNIESGYEETKALLALDPVPDTILVATDTMAAGTLMCLRDAGLRVPEDVQVGGFGDSTVSSVTTPPITTVHFHYRTAGQEATKILLQMMDSKEELPAKELKLGFHIVERPSCRKN